MHRHITSPLFASPSFFLQGVMFEISNSETLFLSPSKHCKRSLLPRSEIFQSHLSGYERLIIDAQTLLCYIGVT